MKKPTKGIKRNVAKAKTISRGKTNMGGYLIPIIAVISSITILFFAGCKQKEPNMFDKAGYKAVEVADKYLNYEITRNEAYEELSEIYSRIEGTALYETNVEKYIKFLLFDFEYEHSDSEVKSSRNRLEQYLESK